MVLLKKITNLLFLFFFVITGVNAQLPQQSQPTEVSDSELKQFATALIKIQSIEQQVQGKMVTAVNGAGIEVQRFSEILKATQDPNTEVDASDKEIEKFDDANQAIEKIQNQAQHDMQNVVRENDLTVNRYQQIMAAVQNDPELQQKLQEQMQK
jgi:hypothetical protein